MFTCKSCGSENDVKSEFCVNCGVGLLPSAAVDEIKNTLGLPAKKSNSSCLFFGISIFVLISAGLIASLKINDVFLALPFLLLFFWISIGTFVGINKKKIREINNAEYTSTHLIAYRVALRGINNSLANAQQAIIDLSCAIELLPPFTQHTIHYVVGLYNLRAKLYVAANMNNEVALGWQQLANDYNRAIESSKNIEARRALITGRDIFCKAHKITPSPSKAARMCGKCGNISDGNSYVFYYGTPTHSKTEQAMSFIGTVETTFYKDIVSSSEFLCNKCVPDPINIPGELIAIDVASRKPNMKKYTFFTPSEYKKLRYS